LGGNAGRRVEAAFLQVEGNVVSGFWGPSRETKDEGSITVLWGGGRRKRVTNHEG